MWSKDERASSIGIHLFNASGMEISIAYPFPTHCVFFSIRYQATTRSKYKYDKAADPPAARNWTE